MITQLFKNTKLLLLSFTVLFFSANALAANQAYKLDSGLSQVSFATIKKQYVVEPAKITQLSGEIKANGQVSILVPLQQISTGVSIRDDRLNTLFFESIKFPTVNISADVQDSLKTAKAAERKTMTFNVEIYGKVKPILAEVIISQSQSHIVVSSLAPLIIKAKDFSIPAANLIKLANTVGDIAISSTVPVNFTVVFEK